MRRMVKPVQIIAEVDGKEVVIGTASVAPSGPIIAVDQVQIEPEHIELAEPILKLAEDQASDGSGLQ